MKIRKIKVNGFGNLENKEIEFKDGINIIQGRNESGKSTLLKFIPGMLYGLNRNKSGKDIPDYESYTPWNIEDFSGTLEYELDDSETYEIFRKFKRRAIKLFNKNGEDIADNFSIGKNKENNFFYEQTKITEETLMSTGISEQEKIKIDYSEQNALIQKITNMVQTGSDSISYNKSKDALLKKISTEIGTDRTTGKPLNITKTNLNEVTQEIEMLEEYKDKQLDIYEQKKKLEKQIEEKTLEINLIKKQKENKEREKVDRTIETGYVKRRERSFSHYIYIVFLILPIIAGIFYLPLVGISILSGAIYLFQYKKYKEQLKEREAKRNRANEDIAKITEEYEDLLYRIEKEENIKSGLLLRSHTLKLDEENILPKLEDLVNLEEQRLQLENKLEELQELEKSINLAIEGIDRAYEKMREGIIPRFTIKLAETIGKTTNGEYKNIVLGDAGLMVELKNGDKVNVTQLSTGTIYQIYLALRIISLKEIVGENMPIILDEPFVYYDNERLANVLKYMSKELEKSQILIFTCSTREEEVLKESNCNFNQIHV